MNANSLLLSGAVSALVTASSHAGVYSLSTAFTDDTSTGISTSNNYTHALSGNEEVTVNGVTFLEFDPSTSLANFA